MVASLNERGVGVSTGARLRRCWNAGCPTVPLCEQPVEFLGHFGVVLRFPLPLEGTLMLGVDAA